jgi:hypothetical protein
MIEYLEKEYIPLKGSFGRGKKLKIRDMDGTWGIKPNMM